MMAVATRMDDNDKMMATTPIATAVTTVTTPTLATTTMAAMATTVMVVTTTMMPVTARMDDGDPVHCKPSHSSCMEMP